MPRPWDVVKATPAQVCLASQVKGQQTKRSTAYCATRPDDGTL